MLLMIAMTLAAAAPFPERTPGMIEQCLAEAIETGAVDVTVDSHKYICSGDVAEHFWAFLADARIETFEQDVGPEGVWLGRDFPLGACFKRTRLADGSRATDGLSCTIWIPRLAEPVGKDAARE